MFRAILGCWCGAGAKGATFVNLVDPKREYISYLVDINPEKQERYVAKTGHSIISPKHIYDIKGKKIYILIMNDNYYKEIQNEINETSFLHSEQFNEYASTVLGKMPRTNKTKW